MPEGAFYLYITIYDFDYLSHLNFIKSVYTQSTYIVQVFFLTLQSQSKGPEVLVQLCKLLHDVIVQGALWHIIVD